MTQWSGGEYSISLRNVDTVGTWSPHYFRPVTSTKTCKGNRKRARVAALESQAGQAKGFVDSLSRNAFPIHQNGTAAEGWPSTFLSEREDNILIDDTVVSASGTQSQSLAGFTSRFAFGSVGPQPVIPATSDGGETAVSETTSSDESFFVPSLSPPDAKVSTDMEIAFSSPFTSAKADVECAAGQTGPTDSGLSDDDPLISFQEDFDEYIGSSDASTAPDTSSQLGHYRGASSMTSLSFADDTFISTPELSLIRAHITILSLISRPTHPIDIWNLYAVSPFNQPEDPSISPLVPENYRPTQSQQLIRHHPVFDMLPWPAVRDKILNMFSLPSQARPEPARGDMPDVVMQIKFDMMDAAGGFRIWGTNAFDEENWEVGQTFFEKWWWALNGEIVRKSNALRRCRGEDVLRLRNKL